MTMKEWIDDTACSFQFCAARAHREEKKERAAGNDPGMLREIACTINDQGTRRRLCNRPADCSRSARAQQRKWSMFCPA